MLGLRGDACVIERFGTAPDGRLFRTRPGGPIKATRYLAVWRQARATALAPAEAASPLAKRPYDLRHAAVSRWLNAGVPPTQVAEWAGHSVRVLLAVYANCIIGEDQRALRLIDASFAAEQPNPQKPPAHAPRDERAVGDQDRVHTMSTGTRTPPATTGPNQTPENSVPRPEADLPEPDWGL
ncbi:hypothetical protein [Pseudofrankia sp. DC12]|uniref:hypothetical protein n=1 Tax=Pseudofrankia sp. DC12 TaxID=683315 RepID=UPI000AA44633|nr:hypothetical protein [Pseudofrankia sp. DC12]